MMTDFLLRFFYGGIIISGGFLVGSMGRLALREARTIGIRAAGSSVYFWLATFVFALGASLMMICMVRLILSFTIPTRASPVWQWLLIAGFLLLFLSNLGFNWAGMRTFTHGKRIWAGYVLSLIGWTIFLSVWTYVR